MREYLDELYDQVADYAADFWCDDNGGSSDGGSGAASPTAEGENGSGSGGGGDEADTDGDGSISRHEFVAKLEQIYRTETCEADSPGGACTMNLQLITMHD